MGPLRGDSSFPLPRQGQNRCSSQEILVLGFRGDQSAVSEVSHTTDLLTAKDSLFL